MDNKLKNNYVRQVSNLKQKINRRDRIIVFDKDKSKKVNVSFSKQLSEINIDYSNYKNAIKKYNKGDIKNIKEVQLAEEKLQGTLAIYNSIFDRRNIEYQKFLLDESEKLLNARLSGIKGVKNVSELDNKFSQVADIINNLTEQMERENGKTDNFTTYSTDDIYDRLFGSANERPYYEEIADELADSKAEFRVYIIKPLRQSGVMSDEMYQVINDLLQL
jgi:Glu-tRNA(Gln) amidotransferase subunit E-like FAD-binding protein